METQQSGLLFGTLRADASAEEDDTPLAVRGPDTSRRRTRMRVIVATALGLLTIVGAVYAHIGRRQTLNDASVVDSQTEAAIIMGCHTEVDGPCFEKVRWAKFRGIFEDPGNYGGLTHGSSFEEFQDYFHRVGYGDCPAPCANQPVPASYYHQRLDKFSRGGSSPCLCLFDVDRTLTGKQGAANQCPGNKAISGVQDPAFSGGDLTLSPLGQNLGTTFCASCHLGVITAGAAGGSDEKGVLHAQMAIGVGGLPSYWSAPGVITSPLVVGCGNDVKSLCARGIVDWYKGQGTVIPPSEVYFFDDLTGNTAGFADHGFNARQVSCKSREGSIGLCGAEPWEIVKAKGTFNCR